MFDHITRLSLAALLGCTALNVGFACRARAQEAGSQDPLQMQHARAEWLKEKRDRVYYTKVFDLSGLPNYHPSRRLSGTIRQAGSNYLADSNLAKYLEDGFRKHHPQV